MSEYVTSQSNGNDVHVTGKEDLSWFIQLTMDYNTLRCGNNVMGDEWSGHEIEESLWWMELPPIAIHENKTAQKAQNDANILVMDETGNYNPALDSYDDLSPQLPQQQEHKGLQVDKIFLRNLHLVLMKYQLFNVIFILLTVIVGVAGIVSNFYQFHGYTSSIMVLIALLFGLILSQYCDKTFYPQTPDQVFIVKNVEMLNFFKKVKLILKVYCVYFVSTLITVFVLFCVFLVYTILFHTKYQKYYKKHIGNSNSNSNSNTTVMAILGTLSLFSLSLVWLFLMLFYCDNLCKIIIYLSQLFDPQKYHKDFNTILLKYSLITSYRFRIYFKKIRYWFGNRTGIKCGVLCGNLFTSCINSRDNDNYNYTDIDNDNNSRDNININIDDYAYSRRRSQPSAMMKAKRCQDVDWTGCCKCNCNYNYNCNCGELCEAESLMLLMLTCLCAFLLLPFIVAFCISYPFWIVANKIIYCFDVDNANCQFIIVGFVLSIPGAIMIYLGYIVCYVQDME